VLLTTLIVACASARARVTLSQARRQIRCVTIVCTLSRLIPQRLARCLSQRHFQEGPARLCGGRRTERGGLPASGDRRAFYAFRHYRSDSDADRAHRHHGLDSHFVVDTPIGRLSWRPLSSRTEAWSTFPNCGKKSAQLAGTRSTGTNRASAIIAGMPVFAFAAIFISWGSLGLPPP
jgi:hypothetical protein